MQRLSVVIITLNEENNIVDCIRSARQVSDDIIVVDSGSHDKTVQLAQQNGATVFSIAWQGFGYSRNHGAAKARENWVMALDADERISPQLVASIRQLTFSQNNYIYRFCRQNHIGQKKIRFGTPGFETITRIYNKNFCFWDSTPVHEKLLAPTAIQKTISGKILHFSHANFKAYKNKSVRYAQLSAEKYALEGRKTSRAKRWFSPVFNALKSYIFQFGFLEGKLGLLIALNIANYSWLKYYYLQFYQESDLREKYFEPRRHGDTMLNRGMTSKTQKLKVAQRSTKKI